jgi:four helix bundle protein
MKKNVVDKSFDFAEKILNVYFFLKENNHYRLAEQFVGSGTSICANIVEAQAAQTKKDFISKMGIASKEARETEFWIKLFNRRELLLDHPDNEFLKNEIKEIIKMLNSIIISSKRNLNDLK